MSDWRDSKTLQEIKSTGSGSIITDAERAQLGALVSAPSPLPSFYRPQMRSGSAHVNYPQTSGTGLAFRSTGNQVTVFAVIEYTKANVGEATEILLPVPTTQSVIAANSLDFAKCAAGVRDGTYPYVRYLSGLGGTVLYPQNSSNNSTWLYIIADNTGELTMAITYTEAA